MNCSICKIMCNDMKKFIYFIFFNNKDTYNIYTVKSSDSISLNNSDEIDEHFTLL